MSDQTWIIAETHPKSEHIAKANVERAGYDVYLPLVVVGDSAEPAPMFPRYLFINTAPMSGQWMALKSVSRISRVLSIGANPCRLPNREMDLMRRREEAGVIRIKRARATESFTPGQVVRIHEGPFATFDAVFERSAGKDRVELLLTFMGGQRRIEELRERVA